MRHTAVCRFGLLAAALVIAVGPGCLDPDDFGTSLFTGQTPGAGGTGGGGAPTPPALRIAMDGYGGGMAAWEQAGEIRAKRYVADVGWEAEEVVATDDGEGVSVALYGVGGSMVVYKLGTKIYALDHPPAGAWDARPTVLDEGPDGVLDPRIAGSSVPGGSVVHAVWRKVVTASDGFTKFAAAIADRHLPGSGWEGARRIAPQSEVSAMNLRVATNGFATYAVWSSVDKFDHDVWGAWSHAGVWGAPRLFGRTASSDGAHSPAAGVDGGGNAIALWVQEKDLLYSEYAAGTGQWTASGPLDPAGSGADRPTVVLNADGAGFAAWSAGGVYARPAGSSRPGPAQRIDVDAGGPIFNGSGVPVVGIDAAGNARAVWGSPSGLYTCRYDKGLGAWEYPEELDTLGSTRPDFAMDASGRGIAVWWSDGFRARVFEPEEGEIVFSTYRDGDMEIYSVRPDGFNSTRRTDDTAADVDPVWSPDRTRIAFLSDRDALTADTFDLYVAKAGSGTTTRLSLFAVDGGNVRDPAWSPSGDRIALVYSYGSGPSAAGGILLVDPDVAGNDQTVSGIESGDRWPTWSPDGKLLAFGRSGAILTLDLTQTGQAPQVRLDAAAEAESPAWSPDGDRIAYASVSATTPGLHILELSSGQTTRITTSTDGAPTWSPDGKRIAFVRMTGLGPRIFHVPATGGTPTEIPDQVAGSADPDWK